MQEISSIPHLIRLKNQSGTWLLMLPTLWALTLASGGRPPLVLLLVFAAGSFLMRSAGVIFNDLADREFDRQVARTRIRPLASGTISVRTALTTALVLVLLAGLLLLVLNRHAALLSPIALGLAMVYPLAKRVIHVPQAILGVAFGWGAVMAWASMRGELEAPAWLLFAATICWAIAYDTIYAIQDRDDDARAGIKSSALFFGKRTWLAVGIALGLMLVLLALAGWLTGLGGAFYATLAAVAGFFSQQVRVLRGPVGAPQAFGMFKQHIWAGTAILLGMFLGFM